MAVNPFYITVDSSSRQTLTTCGCRGKEGTITTKIYQRSDGGIRNPFTIKQNSYYEEDGSLTLRTTIYDISGKIVATHTTSY